MQPLEFLQGHGLCPYPIAKLDALEPWPGGFDVAVCRNAAHCLSEEQLSQLFIRATIPLLVIGPMVPDHPRTEAFKKFCPAVTVHRIDRLTEIAFQVGLDWKEIELSVTDESCELYGPVGAIRLERINPRCKA